MSGGSVVALHEEDEANLWASAEAAEGPAAVDTGDGGEGGQALDPVPPPFPVDVEAPEAPPPEPASLVKAGAELASRLLIDRPDVLRAFYIEFYESGAYKQPDVWEKHYGATTPEAFGQRWYDQHGKWEGYASSGEAVDLQRLLHERPDVMKSYYDGFYESGFDRKPDAWIARVGGASLDDYAKYWFDRHGKWEGYSQSPTGERLSVEQLLHDRPDVLRAFYQEYYEHGAFKHAAEWSLRIGGNTPEDYAKYWYDRHGKWEGYSQPAPAEPAPEPEPDPVPPHEPAPEEEPPLEPPPPEPGPAPAENAGAPEEMVVALAGGSDLPELFG